MYAPVDENGVIFKPAFCDKTGELYEIHPFTKTKLVGFRIPFYAQAVEMVFEAGPKRGPPGGLCRLGMWLWRRTAPAY